MLASPEAVIKQPTKYQGESFIIDLHSRSGFSGSPVFVYQTPLNDLSYHSTLQASLEFRQLERQISDRATLGMGHNLDLTMRVSGGRLELLGIHWMQFPERWESEHAIPDNSESAPTAKRTFVRGMSGMTCVIPAWEILCILDLPKLREGREQDAKAAT
jgi:hypothetical protein